MASLKKIILCSILILSASSLLAQKGTKSPYSVFGLGELNNGEYAYFMGMGNAYTANTDSTIVNNNNPASYSYIKRNRPLFQIGLNGKFTTLTDGSSSVKYHNLGLNQFQMGIPIAKKWGGSFGLTPYSSTGYNIVNSNIVDNDTLTKTINEGAGTISKFHIGTSFKQKIRKFGSIAVGVNANYLFGASNKIQSFEYVSNPDFAFHSRVENKTRISSFNFDLGLIYEQQVGNNSFSIGLKYAPAVKLKGNQDILSYSYSESFYNNYSFNTGFVDTVEYVFDNTGVVYLPEAYNVGFEYRLRGKDQSYLLKFSGDVKIQKWSNYYEDFNGIKTENMFNDRMTTSFGMQFTPHTGVKENNNVTPLLGRLHYRLGIDYTLSHLVVNSTQLKDYGISFGIGIPVTAGNSVTNLNIGAKIGSLGKESGQLTENYTGVYFGVTISPGIYDRWFLKRKYD